ncbi:MAG TPA: YhcH/YjgK/YiaL family protein [Opitutaceae bacterium]|nr:YhcH/YjgK/YiaL family protein [Opitutaceae bacterium]
MAFLGTLAAVRARCDGDPAFRAAFAYAAEALQPGTAAHARIGALKAGATHRHELAGGAYAVEMAYLTKPRAEGFFETHRQFVDVQLVVAGEEVMELAAAAQLGVMEPYDAARDLTKHTDAPAPSVLRVPAGHAAIFWPEDAHMPGLALERPALVRKTVVKVPVGA